MAETESPDPQDTNVELIDATVAGQMIVNVLLHNALKNALDAIAALDTRGLAKPNIELGRADLERAHTTLREIGDHYFQVEADDEHS